MIGDKNSNKLYSIKKVSFKAKTNVDLKFNAPDAGKHTLQIYLICDSYIGSD